MNPAVIQSFIFNYISERLKPERLLLAVDPSFEVFLNNLEKPMNLNEMRTMKEPNYTQFREIISDNLGSPALQLIKDNQEALGLDCDIFDLVYEGFWDLYTFHPMCGDVSAKKLSQWIQKINLQSPEPTEEPAAAEDEGEQEEEGTEEIKEDPLCALVRIRIPRQEPTPEYDDEGNLKEVEHNEEDLDEIPFDDRAVAIPNNVNNQRIWQINQVAQRTLR